MSMCMRSVHRLLLSSAEAYAFDMIFLVFFLGRRKSSKLAVYLLQHRRAYMVRELMSMYEVSETHIKGINLTSISGSSSSKERNRLSAGMGMMCDIMQYLRKYCAVCCLPV